MPNFCDFKTLMINICWKLRQAFPTQSLADAYEVALELSTLENPGGSSSHVWQPALWPEPGHSAAGPGRAPLWTARGALRAGGPAGAGAGGSQDTGDRGGSARRCSVGGDVGEARCRGRRGRCGPEARACAVPVGDAPVSSTHDSAPAHRPREGARAGSRAASPGAPGLLSRRRPRAPRLPTELGRRGRSVPCARAREDCGDMTGDAGLKGGSDDPTFLSKSVNSTEPTRGQTKRKSKEEWAGPCSVRRGAHIPGAQVWRQQQPSTLG